MEPAAFFDKYLNAARAVRRATRLAPSVALAQWAVESGYESPEWVGYHNLAGITDGGPPNFLRFDNVEHFLRVYVATLWNGYYNHVLAAAALGFPAIEQARLLGESPWDAGHYDAGGGPGEKLIAIMIEHRLDKYDHDECSSDWARDARIALVREGITDGQRPHDPATREEVWTMLHKYNAARKGG